MGSEAGTSLIIKELLTLGKQVYLPKIVDGEMFPALYGECEKGAFGILEPVNGIYTGGIDVTVVPLLAVNAKGYRIGYGKGFYDRFLKDRHTVKAGLGYYFQIEDFSEDEWDVPLDAFVCERGIKYYGK